MQTFSKTHNIVYCKTDAFVELNNVIVRGANLQVDFWTAFLPKQLFGFVHHLSADSGLPVLWVDGQVVDPSPVPFIPGHDGGDDLIGAKHNQKELGLDFEFALNIVIGIVPRNNETAIFPQLDNGLFVLYFKRSDLCNHVGAGVINYPAFNSWCRKQSVVWSLTIPTDCIKA